MPAASDSTILDLRTLAPQARASAFLTAFDGLAPGADLLLVSPEDPHSFLRLLQQERKGQFEWSPIEEDPRCWHVEIHRRLETGPGGGRRPITEALEWDHDRLDQLESRAFEALQGGDVGEARRLFSAFQHGLNRHIRFEEELIFPVFEMKAGLPFGGPTAMMRAEHREIRMLLEEIVRGLDGGASGVEEPRRALVALLRDHNRREEAVLYPGTDELLSEAESDTLLSRIQSL